MSYREIPEDRILGFRATPGFRGWKHFFTEESTTHPAKMNLNLIRWILETYTEPGETVLDPMAGTGSTAVLAALKGRHGVAVEYEPKFCDMIRDNIELTERQATLTPKGRMAFIQGDARELSKLLGELDAIVTSPPYSECEHDYRHGLKVLRGNFRGRRAWEDRERAELSEENIGRLPHGDIDAVVTSPPYGNRLSDVAVDDGDLARMGYRQAIDVVLTSPPYSDSNIGGDDDDRRIGRLREAIERGDEVSDRNIRWLKAMEEGRRGSVCFNLERGYSEDSENIGNLPHGDINSIITSPPFGPSQKGGGIFREGYKAPGEEEVSDPGLPQRHGRPLSNDPRNIDNLEYGQVEAVVTSPPYEGGPFSHAGGHGGAYAGGIAQRDPNLKPMTLDSENIGTLKGETYLEAMLRVYRECWKVLRAGGRMVIVVKNFIRDKQVVRLDLDTIRLCEATGFRLADRWYLRLPTRSFWKILYHRKYPDVPEVEHEDVLVFEKVGEWKP